MKPSMSFFLPDNEKMQLTERVSCIFDPADKALLLSEQAADGVLDLVQNAILKPQNNFVDKIMSLMRYKFSGNART